MSFTSPRRKGNSSAPRPIAAGLRDRLPRVRRHAHREPLMPSRNRLAVILALACLNSSMTASAQDYPNRYIRVIVGPGPDLVARLFGPKITEILGQQVVIEPRPGAGGVIAAQTVATAPADGYTLLLATASYTINTALQTSPYDMRKDFAPIGLTTTTPFVLVVHPSVPATTLAELIALA